MEPCPPPVGVQEHASVLEGLQPDQKNYSGRSSVPDGPCSNRGPRRVNLLLHGAKGRGRTRLLNEERGPPLRRSLPRASAYPRTLRKRRSPAGCGRTRGRGVQPARYARRIDRSGRRARSSPRCVSFRIPCLKRSAVRPSLHCEPARGRARLRFTRTWGLGSRNVHLILRA